MTNALIGFSGFVGSTLLKQTQFESLYRSTNICDIKGQTFDNVVCAGAPAQKWIVNLEPVTDFQNISGLISHLKTVRCKKFILISTVDVFKDSIGVDEETKVDEYGLHAYGLHRRLLEKFVESHFPNHLIVRLPGLVGPGLRKNIIFDFLNDNNLHAIDSRGVFQFYPIVNLWYDIQAALHAGLRLVHLTAEPICVADISVQCFGKVFENVLSKVPAKYDIRTLYSSVYGSVGNYQYCRRETLQVISAYAQSEPRAVNLESDVKS